ncbi:MAG: SufD family Fe-S cluster assembly protein [Candidatus Latescibacterota bacterium]
MSEISGHEQRSDTATLEEFARREYKWGFVTDIEADSAPPGLSEEIIRFISARKDEPDFMLEWRLKAYRNWLKMGDPTRRPPAQRWARVQYPDIDYQSIVYYSAPRRKQGPESLKDVDPELLRTYERLGIPLEEQKLLAGVAVDAVFDSVSVATTFKEKLAELGIVFCSFSEAVRNHPDLVRKYLGSVVPYNDNFFAALNSAVFSDGSFAYIPKGVRCPMELSTYFRINAANTGQFERTLIIAEEGSYVSYLEGCLPAWEEVSCGDRLRNVRDVAVTDTVLNEEGEEASVAKIMRRRFGGDLIQITPCSAGNRFHVTPEHPVLTIQRERLRSSLRADGRWPDIDRQKLAQAEPAYVPAGQVQAGDLLVFPVSQVERDDPSLTDDFLRLLGYYVAEGCTTHFNGCKAVAFSLGSHETDVIHEVQDLVTRVSGKTASVTHDAKRNGACVVVYSGDLWDLLHEHGGRYAEEKRFSKAVMDLPPARQKLAVDAYYRGDGRVSEDGRITRVRAVTVSRPLAFQLQELLARQGVFAYINVRETFAETMKNGRTIHHRKRYVVYYTSNARGQRAIPRDGCFLVPVMDVERQPHEGFVYNLETQTDPHSYLVKGFAVHNCTAPIRDENQLHAAVVELVALDRAQIKYSTVQNWYPGDAEGRGGVYNFVTKRGACRGARSKISWTQVETGSAITWKYPSCILQGDDSVGEFYSVAVTSRRQQADTGTKMVHLGKNTRSTIVSKGISAQHGQNTYRGLVRVNKGATGARNFTQCDSMLIGDQCGAHTFPYIEVRNPTAQVEHEASTSKIGEDQIFYFNQRGISTEDAVSMIVNGFCKQVLAELPMEFAVEAQKLLGVSLEGSVG